MPRFAHALALSALPLAAALGGCATIMPTEQAVSITGEIAYRERIALPRTAQIEVELQDVSLADAPSRTIARQAFSADGRQVPIAFSMTVDQRRIDDRGRYSVSARITDSAGRLMFISDTHNGVLFDGRTAIDMGTIHLIKTR